MAYCSQCGQQLQDGMAFCGRCGAAVAQGPETAPLAQYSAVEEQGTAAPLQQTYQQPLQVQLPPPQLSTPLFSTPQFSTPQPYPPQPRSPQFTWNVSISGRDLGLWLRDGVILSAVALALGFVAALVFGLFLSGGNHGNPAQWAVVGVLIVGMALGGHSTLSAPTGGIPGFDFPSNSPSAQSFAASVQVDIRVSVLLVTIAILFAARFLARRPERRKPSATLTELTFRTLGTSVAFVAVMAVLAAVVKIHAAYGLLPNSANDLFGLDNSVALGVPVLALSVGSMLLWPLVLVGLVSWGSAFALWLHRSATIAPNPAAAKLAWLWTCRPAFLAVRAQILVTVVLAGVGTYVYAVIRVLQVASQQGISGGASTRIVLGLLLGLPNLGALAGAASLGVSSSAATSVIGAVDTATGTPGGDNIGFFGAQHPAVLYLLLAASVIGVIVAARWTVGKSWDHSRALLGPVQAWRGAVLGAAAWTALGFAAQLSLSSGASSGAQDGFDLTLGPSLPGLLLAGAVWGLVTCLAVSFFAGHLGSGPRTIGAPAVPQGFGRQYSSGTQPAPAPALAPAPVFAATGSHGPGAPIPAQPMMVLEDPDVISMDLVVTLAPPDEYDDYGEE